MRKLLFILSLALSGMVYAATVTTSTTLGPVTTTYKKNADGTVTKYSYAKVVSPSPTPTTDSRSPYLYTWVTCTCTCASAACTCQGCELAPGTNCTVAKCVGTNCGSDATCKRVVTESIQDQWSGI